MRKKDLSAVKAWLVQQSSVSKKGLSDFLVRERFVQRKYVRIAIKQLIDNHLCYEQYDGCYTFPRGLSFYRCFGDDECLENALKRFPFPICLCIESSIDLNQFVALQVFSPRRIVYAPKIVHDDLAAHLSVQGYQPIRLRKGVRPYCNDKTVFISGLNWRTPLDRQGKRVSNNIATSVICHPTIEKFLIDVLSGDFEVDEAITEELFQNALHNYAYNVSVMLRYAKDRSKEELLKDIVVRCGLKEIFYDRPRQFCQRMD